MRFIRDAAAQGCDLAVLPEFHLTDWVPTDLSQINIPYAGPLVRLGTPAEGMGVATIDLAVLGEAEQNYAIRAGLAGIYNRYHCVLRVSLPYRKKAKVSRIYLFWSYPASGSCLGQSQPNYCARLLQGPPPPMASTDNPNDEAAKESPLPTQPEPPWQQAHGTAASCPE